MAKKVTTKITPVSLPKGSKGYYYKNNIFIKPSEKFIYEMMVYEFIENGAGLADSKETSVKEFKGFNTTKIIEKNKKQYIQSIDLIGAPEKFLIDNNFKLIE